MLGATFTLPGNFSNGAFYLIGVLKDHESLSRNLLGHVLGLLASEILFEQIDFIVLLNATLSSSGEISSCTGKAKSRISIELLSVSLDMLLICVVHVSGPSTNRVIHSAVFSLDALRVHCVDLESRDVVKDDLVGVP